MSTASDYRNLAAKFRREAECAVLPQLRQVNSAAAERWEFLADELERTEGSAKANRMDWFR
uniref:hypothetical protein n=1 Tax=Altererythrobacter segetis TaxID=1104773 RepID=UPI001A9C6BDB|nr:hypothetical protein [Altererythrobacter segetis]